MKGKYIQRIFFVLAAGIIIFTAARHRILAGMQEDLKENVIRFHIRANSDSKKDQEEKLKVRDAVINYVSPYMENAETKEEALVILKEKEGEIQKIAENTLVKQGNPQKATVSFTTEEFPEKEYGNYVFPKGRYDAVRVDLGEAKGHNWWCVMFPDLCITKDEKVKINREAEKKMKKLLGENTVRVIKQKKYLRWLWEL
nr:stage II sporulation protein R [uncultured Anaerostipes sp.]